MWVGVIVIMNRDYYKREMLDRILEDNSFYKEANNDCSKHAFKKKNHI